MSCRHFCDKINTVIKMKKIFSVFTVALFIFSFLCITSNAADPVTLTLKSETRTVYAGDDFSVDLLISDYSKLSGAVIDINFDKSQLEYVSGNFGGILDVVTESTNISLKKIENDEKNCIRFTYLSPTTAITSQGILLSLKFHAKENASGNAKITLSIPNPADFIDKDLVKLPYTLVDTSLNIKNISVPLTGDESSSSAEISSVIESSTENISVTDKAEIPAPSDSNENHGNNTVYYIVTVAAVAAVFAVAVTVIIFNKRKGAKK